MKLAKQLMTDKQRALETISAMPDDCSLKEIAERIAFIAALRRGLDQLDRGESVSHEEVKQKLASWLYTLVLGSVSISLRCQIGTSNVSSYKRRT